MCPWGKCPGGTCPGGSVLSPFRLNCGDVFIRVQCYIFQLLMFYVTSLGIREVSRRTFKQYLCYTLCLLDRNYAIRQ